MKGRTQRGNLKRVGESGMDLGLAEIRSLVPLFEHYLRGFIQVVFPLKKSDSFAHGAAEENIGFRHEPCFLRKVQRPQRQSNLSKVRWSCQLGYFLFNRTTKNQKGVVLVFPF